VGGRSGLSGKGKEEISTTDRSAVLSPVASPFSSNGIVCLIATFLLVDTDIKYPEMRLK
jgi:hypothetical protein